MQRRDCIQLLGLLPFAASANIAYGATTESKDQYRHALIAQPTDWKIFKDKAATHIWSFDKHLFGKPLYARQGEKIHVKVSNHLHQGLGVHWHGIRLQNNMDGVPGVTQKPITDKTGLFEYTFTSPDAGTYWYHAHSNSIEQVERGLLGPLIIKEPEAYPVDDDIVLLVKDWKLNDGSQIQSNFDNRHEMSHDGRWGNVITVNGDYHPVYTYNTNARIRLRFINGSNARIVLPDVSAFEQATVIAIDGHPILPTPYKPMYLAPGMRMDIVADMHSPNHLYQLSDIATRTRQKLLTIQTTSRKQREKPLLRRPAALPANPVSKPRLNSAKEIQISLEGGAMSMGMMKGMVTGAFWTINGKAVLAKDGYEQPLLSLKQNTSYLLNIHNNTRFAHPMHIHGHTFKVLSTTESHWSDTILLLPEDTIQVAFVADNPGLWMFHCHILGHQASGMTGVIEVA